MKVPHCLRVLPLFLPHVIPVSSHSSTFNFVRLSLNSFSHLYLIHSSLLYCWQLTKIKEEKKRKPKLTHKCRKVSHRDSYCMLIKYHEIHTKIFIRAFKLTNNQLLFCLIHSNYCSWTYFD